MSLMKNKATIIHHQGFGDLFTSNSLCIHYANKYEEIVILVSTESRLKVVQSMYRNIPNIRCELADVSTHYNGVDSCLNCMTIGSPVRCPRGGSKCIFVDYSRFHDYNNLKIGCFDNYGQWSSFLSNKIKLGSSFSHSFYDYHNISLNDRIKLFDISRDESENNLYEQIVSSLGKEYAVIHDDPNRGLGIPNVKSNLPRYYLNSKSNNMIDQLKIIEQSKEVHMIDSSYSVLVYFLSFSNQNVKEIPKFLHTLGRRDRDINIYRNPTPDSWTFI